MSKPDLLQKAAQMREALSRYDKDQLIEVLSHVFTHYVLEGDASSATLMPAAPPKVQADDLSGLSFAQLIEKLQLRLDVPELRHFEVQEGRVSVRIEGRLVPIGAPALAPTLPLRPPAETPRPKAPAAPAPAAPAPAKAPGPAPAPASSAPKEDPAAKADEGGGRFAMLEID